jgi:hypothetical protein
MVLEVSSEVGLSQLSTQTLRPNGVDVINVIPIYVRSTAWNDLEPWFVADGIRQRRQVSGGEDPGIQEWPALTREVHSKGLNTARNET